MRRRTFLSGLGFSVMGGAVPAWAQTADKLQQSAPSRAGVLDWSPPSDEAIRGILRMRIEDQRYGVGLVVGLLTPGRRSIIAYGRAAAGGSRLVDGDTLFELNSVTKTFTALLLSTMAVSGEVKL
jgi:CubicO group peptidase (beta-lactamase class C family)